MAYYCPSQNRKDSQSLAYNGPDNLWEGYKLSPPEGVRSSYLARLFEVKTSSGTVVMPAGTPTTEDGWKLRDWLLPACSRKVIYSDFTGVDGFRGGGIVQGYIWAPHRRQGFNRLFGDGSVLWAKPNIVSRKLTSVAPTDQQMVKYWKELDRRR